MQSLTYQQSTGINAPVLIYENQRKAKPGSINHDDVRSAVRAWAADCRSREFVAALVAEEWRRAGGEGLDIPTDPHRQMQKIFRWLDGETEYAAENVRMLTPATDTVKQVLCIANSVRALFTIAIRRLLPCVVAREKINRQSGVDSDDRKRSD